jgi:hypothetical protein
LKLRWTEEASRDLIELAERSPRRAAAVDGVDGQGQAKGGFSLGRPVANEDEDRYWPVPPLGVFYHVDGDVLVVSAVVDTRRRREAW